MNTGFVETETEQQESKGIREMYTRDFKMGFWQRSGVSFKEPKVLFGFLQM